MFWRADRVFTGHTICLSDPVFVILLYFMVKEVLMNNIISPMIAECSRTVVKWGIKTGLLA